VNPGLLEIAKKYDERLRTEHDTAVGIINSLFIKA
jgi:hypothetical protein